MKVKKKGKLKAAFIDVAQIVSNILVQEPANKNRIKREIYEAKKAGEPIQDYRHRLLEGQAYSAFMVMFTTLPVTVIGGALSETFVPWIIEPTVVFTVFSLGLAMFGAAKMMHLGSNGGFERMSNRFERQAERKLKRLQKAQNKRARQLLTSNIPRVRTH